jgi:hypothetical protein
VRTLTDVLKHEVATGTLPAGSISGDFTNMAVALAGAKFRLVKGYIGFQSLALALERGEVEVICGSWAGTKLRYPNILSGASNLQVFVHGDPSAKSDLTKARVPLLESIVTNDLNGKALRFFTSQLPIAYPFLIPPGVPPQTLEALRRPFAETLSDPSLAAQAKQQNVDLSFTDAQTVQADISQLYQTPVDVVARLRSVLTLR